MIAMLMEFNVKHSPQTYTSTRVLFYIAMHRQDNSWSTNAYLFIWRIQDLAREATHTYPLLYPATMQWRVRLHTTNNKCKPGAHPLNTPLDYICLHILTYTYICLYMLTYTYIYLFQHDMTFNTIHGPCIQCHTYNFISLDLAKNERRHMFYDQLQQYGKKFNKRSIFWSSSTRLDISTTHGSWIFTYILAFFNMARNALQSPFWSSGNRAGILLSERQASKRLWFHGKLVRGRPHGHASSCRETYRRT